MLTFSTCLVDDPTDLSGFTVSEALAMELWDNPAEGIDEDDYFFMVFLMTMVERGSLTLREWETE